MMATESKKKAINLLKNMRRHYGKSMDEIVGTTREEKLKAIVNWEVELRFIPEKFIKETFYHVIKETPDSPPTAQLFKKISQDLLIRQNNLLAKSLNTHPRQPKTANNTDPYSHQVIEDIKRQRTRGIPKTEIVEKINKLALQLKTSP